MFGISYVFLRSTGFGLSITGLVSTGIFGEKSSMILTVFLIWLLVFLLAVFDDFVVFRRI
jgi:hypothetical protein